MRFISFEIKIFLGNKKKINVIFAKIIKMKNVFSFFGFLIGLTVLFSCDSKRDTDGDLLFGLTQNANNNNSANLLSKVTTTDIAGDIDLSVYTYTAGRLTTVSKTDDVSTTNISISYNGNQINAVESDRFSGTDHTHIKLTLEYNGGKLISAAGPVVVNGENQKSEMSFSYGTDGKISKIKNTLLTEDPNNPGNMMVSQTAESTYVFSGVNISNHTLKTVSYSPTGNPTNTVILLTDFSNYDTFKNPYASLPLNYLLISENHFINGDAVLGVSQNNYRKTVINTTGVTITDTVAYTYNTDNYPIKSNSSSNGSSVYEYIKP